MPHIVIILNFWITYCKLFVYEFNHSEYFASLILVLYLPQSDEIYDRTHKTKHAAKYLQSFEFQA